MRTQADILTKLSTVALCCGLLGSTACEQGDVVRGPALQGDSEEPAPVTGVGEGGPPDGAVLIPADDDDDEDDSLSPSEPDAEVRADARVSIGPPRTGDAGREAGASALDATMPTRDAGAGVRSACILPLGDSITQSDASHLSYRYWLWDKIRQTGRSVDFVGSEDTGFSGTPLYPSAAFDRDHEGHWGFRVDEVRDRLPGWLSQYPVGIVLLHLGTNDLIQKQSLDSTLAELAEVIAILRSKNPQVAILLAQVIPTTYEVDDQLTKLNERLPELAQSKSSASSPIIVVDQSSGFDPVADTFDGVHPDEGGEKKMAERWYEALRPLLEDALPCP